MIELYSIKDAAKIFGQTESRLRYWMQSGFLWPSVRRGGQYFYTFDDLIAVRTGIELLDSGLSVQKVRKAIAELRKQGLNLDLSSYEAERDTLKFSEKEMEDVAQRIWNLIQGWKGFSARSYADSNGTATEFLFHFQDIASEK